MHEERSKIRYSNTFSCGVITAAVPHCAGKVPLPLMLLTWKSLKSTRPHWFSGVAVVGVLKVNWKGVLSVFEPEALP